MIEKRTPRVITRLGVKRNNEWLKKTNEFKNSVHKRGLSIAAGTFTAPRCEFMLVTWQTRGNGEWNADGRI